MGMHGAGWHSYLRYDEERDRPQVSLALLRRVLGYVRPYWWRAVLLVALIILASLVDLVTPLLFRDLLDNALPNRDGSRLNWLAVGLLGVPVLVGLMNVIRSYLGSRVGEGIICDLRQSLYAHLQRMSMRFFTHTNTGEMMSRLNNDVNGAQRAVTGTLIELITNIIALVSTLLLMISLEWRLTLIGAMVLPLFVLPGRRVARILREIVRRRMGFMAQMNAHMSETLNISGALLVKIFGRTSDEVRRFSEQAVRVREVAIKQAMAGRWFFMGMSLVGAAGTAIVYWLGGHLVLRGEFTIGTIVAFSTYLSRLYRPLTALTNARVQFASSLVSFERVFEVLDLPAEIQDRPGAVALERVEGQVRFEDVSFSYVDDEVDTPQLEDVPRFGWRGSGQLPPRSGEQRNDQARPPRPSDDVSPWALRDVSFEMQPAQLVALVGPSGAGKTTITYLLPRLYDPTGGRITLDGHDLRDIQLSSLAVNIGMVTQETYLFHDTLRANLLYARPEATDEELEAACRAANIHDFIAQLPHGYDTVVGERGYRLSGGERQRVALARVILKDPRVLILDEATSNLDSESERLIQHALERVMKGRTTLVIAHRLSTILSADVILVIDEGQLVERGTHAELLARDGVYARLYRIQFLGGEGDRDSSGSGGAV